MMGSLVLMRSVNGDLIKGGKLDEKTPIEVINPSARMTRL
jgi:hypothetical protein